MVADRPKLPQAIRVTLAGIPPPCQYEHKSLSIESLLTWFVRLMEIYQNVDISLN